MSKRKTANPSRKRNAISGDELKPDSALQVDQSKDETGARALARKLLQPSFKSAVTASTIAKKALGDDMELPGIGDYIHCVQTAAKAAEKGDLSMASRMLASQAIALDSLFGELARRAALNLGDYPDASERYGRLALRAQGNCRTTLEALSKLHQPREQTVRHVHVNEGGQAVVADHFHNHAGGAANVETNKQSLATGAAGSGPPMLGKDAQGNGVPIPFGEGTEAVPDARRDESRRA